MLERMRMRMMDWREGVRKMVDDNRVAVNVALDKVANLPPQIPVHVLVHTRTLSEASRSIRPYSEYHRPGLPGE
jgi:hypothetical protein